jgi:hypothetical protein
LYECTPYRPPSEANSLLIRATRNCPWNRCAFCSMYKGERFEFRQVDEIKRDISNAAELERRVLSGSWQPGVLGSTEEVALSCGLQWIRADGRITVFLGDSNSVIMRTRDLVDVLSAVYESFPGTQRVTSYARAKSLIKKPAYT